MTEFTQANVKDGFVTPDKFAPDVSLRELATQLQDYEVQALRGVVTGAKSRRAPADPMHELIDAAYVVLSGILHDKMRTEQEKRDAETRAKEEAARAKEKAALDRIEADRLAAKIASKGGGDEVGVDSEPAEPSKD